MIYVFLILLVLAIIINSGEAYLPLLKVLPNAYTYLIIMAGILVLEVFVCIILRIRGNKLTRVQEKWFEKEEEADRAAAEKDLQEIDSIARANKARIKELNGQVSAAKQELRDMDILAPEDWNLTTVNWLYNDIASRRADSIKEALQHYDTFQSAEAKKKAEAEGLLRWAREQDALDQLRRQQECDQLYRQFEQDLGDIFRQKERDRREKETLEELKKIRKHLDG